jgi:hypothetical protein
MKYLFNTPFISCGRRLVLRSNSVLPAEVSICGTVVLVPPSHCVVAYLSLPSGCAGAARTFPRSHLPAYISGQHSYYSWLPYEFFLEVSVRWFTHIPSNAAVSGVIYAYVSG